MASLVTLDDYKLSNELLGHTLDVRGVAETRDGIVSGSRDKTAKVWKSDGEQFFLETTLSDHTNFVSTVCYLEDERWICTGGNDSTIYIYKEGSNVPFATLKGHKSAVCALSKGLERNTLISGSWDQTGRIWKIADTGTATFVALEGHEAAVWAVTSLKPNRIVTGSADKNILFWNEKGEKLRVLKGHTDCVRGLIALDDGSLISCGNDAVIRFWNDDGECTKELFGHENYIYAIALNKIFDETTIVSGGEDGTIRMWNSTVGALGNCLTLPAQSVWSVACLRNGDIVTGTSDGIVRVFTKDPGRMAPPDLLQAYETTVKSKVEESTKMLGGVKHTDLPGPEALEDNGTENAVRIIRHADGEVMAYQWNDNKWNQVGSVMGASGGTQKTSGKKLFEGKEYDYVFDVDISDTEPSIKLPYNTGEDPWQAAHTFIHKHSLPQVYLEQVANFITKNANMTFVPQQTSTGFVDPFTGGARYIPGTNATAMDVTGNADPFTGASSYTTKESRIPQIKHFPHQLYMTFDNYDAAKIQDKLREFNTKTGDNNISVSENLIEAVVKLSQKEGDFDKLSIEALQHLLKWPKEIIFPVLDVTRLAVRNEQICHGLVTSDFLKNLIENLSTLPANQLMAVRCIVNMLIHPFGSQHIEPKLNEILKTVSRIQQGSANLQIAIATLYLNLTVSQVKYANSAKCHQITEALLEFMKWAVDLEASYRAMQALGNLTCTPFGSETAAQVASVDSVASKIRQFAGAQHPSGFEKVAACAKALAMTF